MNIDERTWDSIRKLLIARNDVQEWEKEYLTSSISELQKIEGLFVEAESKIVTTSYLDFLREQIGLNARGREWSDILQRRLDALSPFENRNRVIFTLSTSKGRLMADFPVELDRILRVESETMTNTL